ncbi:hypothetical protein AKJ16_DCAP16488 [Drosera capensis]
MLGARFVEESEDTTESTDEDDEDEGEFFDLKDITDEQKVGTESRETEQAKEQFLFEGSEQFDKQSFVSGKAMMSVSIKNGKAKAKLANRYRAVQAGKRPRQNVA